MAVLFALESFVNQVIILYTIITMNNPVYKCLRPIYNILEKQHHMARRKNRCISQKTTYNKKYNYKGNIFRYHLKRV